MTTPEQVHPGAVRADEVTWIYREILGREPGPAEIEHQVEHATHLRDLLAGVFASPEHLARRAAATQGGQALQRERFIAGLRLLNDTLSETTLAERYWIWGGLLIGLAREGMPLAHDSADADFCVPREDLDHLLAAIPALRAAGFQPLYRFVNNAGLVTEFSFLRDGAKFEFFLLDRDGDRFTYFDLSDGVGRPGELPTQAAASIPAQARVVVDFIGRRWRKTADHDRELTAMYGDWRTPDADWWFMDDRAIQAREPWTKAATIPWDGRIDDLDRGSVR